MKVSKAQPPPIKQTSRGKFTTVITSNYVSISYEFDNYLEVYFLSEENWKNNKTHKLLTNRWYDRVDLLYSEYWWREGILWEIRMMCKRKGMYIKRDFDL